MATLTRDRETSTELLDPLAKSWAVLLKTRKRDGSWVATPINLAVDSERAYFGTPAGSGKVKRLRNFDAVELAPCTLRGKPTGTTIAAKARRLEGEESGRARQRLLRKYPLVHRFLVPLELKLKRIQEVRYELDGFAPLDEAALPGAARAESR